MNTFCAKILLAAFIACILTACGTSPTPIATEIPPTVEQTTPKPQHSRTPIPGPTRRPSQTVLPHFLGPTQKPQTTRIYTNDKKANILINACQISYFYEEKLSPSKQWYVCGGGPDFNVINIDGTSWHFSLQEQLGIEYYSDLRLLHWTSDEIFLYFSVMNPIDGPSPIPANAEALFRMDLSTGKVATLLNGITKDPANQHLYAVSISPTSRRLAYSMGMGESSIDGRPQTKLHLIDLQNSDEKVIPIEPEYSTIGEFVWSKNGQQLAYTLYSYADDYCKDAYSIRWLNLVDDNAITFIKNIPLDSCSNGPTPKFNVVAVSSSQVMLKKGDDPWMYDVETQKLKLQVTATPTP